MFSRRRARCGGLSLKLCADEADEFVNLFGGETGLEGGHAVAAVSDLARELLISMFEGMAFFEVWHFQRFAFIELGDAAFTIRLVATNAGCAVGRADGCELVGSRRRFGRGG